MYKKMRRPQVWQGEDAEWKQECAFCVYGQVEATASKGQRAL